MKVRSIVLVALLFFCNSIAFSQVKRLGLSLQLSNPINDVHSGWLNNDWESLDGFDVKNKSISPGIMIHYYRNDYTQFRLRVGLTKVNYTKRSNESSNIGQGVWIEDVDQTKFHFAPGILWSMSQNKFKLLGGFELPLTLHRKFTLENSHIYDNPIYNEINKYIIPNGYTIGAGAIIGIEYSFTDWISLGAEFSPYLYYYKLGGEIKFERNGNLYNLIDKNEGFSGYENRFSLQVTFSLINKKVESVASK